MGAGGTCISCGMYNCVCFDNIVKRPPWIEAAAKEIASAGRRLVEAEVLRILERHRTGGT